MHPLKLHAIGLVLVNKLCASTVIRLHAIDFGRNASPAQLWSTSYDWQFVNLLVRQWAGTQEPDALQPISGKSGYAAASCMAAVLCMLSCDSKPLV